MTKRGHEWKRATGSKPGVNAFQVLHIGSSFTDMMVLSVLMMPTKPLHGDERPVNISNVRYFSYQNKTEKQEIFIIILNAYDFMHLFEYTRNFIYSGCDEYKNKV